MDDDARVVIRTLSTGVPGLDAVLGGGLPEYSFNLITGGPGAGKTTLAQQILFANATPERPALYFTVLGEPTIKLLRYQQQFRFFDVARTGSEVKFFNLTADVLRQEMGAVLDRITAEVERESPGLVVVDSVPTLASAVRANGADQPDLDAFVQRLALQLTSWEVTSFLLGEYAEAETRDAAFAVADGIVCLSQVVDRNSVVRKCQVLKMRGRPPLPGLHTFRIGDDGVQLFPRIPERPRAADGPRPRARLSTGVPGLDEMMGGGVPRGDRVLLVGPAGTGKTTFATQFIVEGVRRGEAGVVAVFEERPEDYIARARTFGWDLDDMTRQSKLKVVDLRPSDLSVDETLHEIGTWVTRLGASRVVIDSLAGFEAALAVAFRDDFRESLQRLVATLSATGVTVLITADASESYQEMTRFTANRMSFLSDDLIAQQFMESEGELRKILTVVKMRGSAHSNDLRAYEITPRGAVLGEILRDYQGVLTGVPRSHGMGRRPSVPGLTDREVAVLNALARARGATVEELAEQTGIRPVELESALERLAALDYATKAEEGSRVVYRALARPMR